MTLPARYTGPSMTAREAIYRERKVARIVGYLRSLDIGAEEARHYTIEERCEVAELAHVNPPSARSWASVCSALDTGRQLSVMEQLEVERTPIELSKEICVFCEQDGVDHREEHGLPCHALCAEEDAYRRNQERTDEMSESL